MQRLARAIGGEKGTNLAEMRLMACGECSRAGRAVLSRPARRRGREAGAMRARQDCSARARAQRSKSDPGHARELRGDGGRIASDHHMTSAFPRLGTVSTGPRWMNIGALLLLDACNGRSRRAKTAHGGKPRPASSPTSFLFRHRAPGPAFQPTPCRVAPAGCSTAATQHRRTVVLIAQPWNTLEHHIYRPIS